MQNNTTGCLCTTNFKLCPLEYDQETRTVAPPKNVKNGCDLQHYLTTTFARYTDSVSIVPYNDNICMTPDEMHKILYDAARWKKNNACLGDWWSCKQENLTKNNSRSNNAQRLAKLMYGKANAKNFTAHQQQQKREPKSFKNKGR